MVRTPLSLLSQVSFPEMEQMDLRLLEAHRAATRFDVPAGTVDHNRASEPHLQKQVSRRLVKLC